MTLNEAAQRGISRLRQKQWASPHAYLKLDLLPDGYGPWVHLYDRRVQQVIDAPTPQTILRLDLEDMAGWDAYDGPVDQDDR